MPFAIADEIADWRFAKVQAAQRRGGSSCEEILSWTQQQAVPMWGEPVVRMVDTLLDIEPSGRPTAAQAVTGAWRHFHAVGRARHDALAPSAAPPSAAAAAAKSSFSSGANGL